MSPSIMIWPNVLLQSKSKYFNYNQIIRMSNQWATSDYYEGQLQSSPSFFTIFHIDPDQSEQLLINYSINKAHLSGQHKHIQSVPQHSIQLESSNGTDTQAPIPQQTQNSPEDNDQIKPVKVQERSKQVQKQHKKRQDDNNNAHKMFITTLNEVLAHQGLLETIKKNLKKEGKAFPKGSRYSIITRLIDTKMLLIKRNEEGRLETILNRYSSKIQTQFQLTTNITPVHQLLYSLIKPYQSAVRLFLQGEITKATQCIYDLQCLKQGTYKKQGVRKVKQYMKQKGL